MFQKEIRLSFARQLIVGFLFASICTAQLPDCYRSVSRVTWVVENIDRVRSAWEAIGLSYIHEYPNIQLVGEFRGRPVSIYGWQITGRLGNLMVDMIQPAEGQANAYTDFLRKHGDGILSIAHEVASRQVLQQEIVRMKAKDVGVLQQVTVLLDKTPVTYTYFDTEPEGKFALGLVQGASAKKESVGAETVTHFGWVVWDAAAVSAYWDRLGFPAFPMQKVAPRVDERFEGGPLALAFQVGFQRYAQFRYEWVSAPPQPPEHLCGFLEQASCRGYPAHRNAGGRSAENDCTVRETWIPRASGRRVGRSREAGVGTVCLHGYRYGRRHQSGIDTQRLKPPVEEGAAGWT
jgi:hypothetical protein